MLLLLCCCWCKNRSTVSVGWINDSQHLARGAAVIVIVDDQHRETAAAIHVIVVMMMMVVVVVARRRSILQHRVQVVARQRQVAVADPCEATVNAPLLRLKMMMRGQQLLLLLLEWRG